MNTEQKWLLQDTQYTQETNKYKQNKDTQYTQEINKYKQNK